MCLPLLPSAIAGYITLISFCAIPLFFITLLTLFLMWRHKKERYILLFLLALSLTYLHPYIPLTSFHFLSLEERQVPGTLTVVSWNADNFQLSEDTLRAAVQTITHLHPDIICLQERPHTSLLDIAKIKSALHDYLYMVTNSREDEILNVIVFSRFPLSHPQSHYFTHTFNKYLSVDVHLPQTISSKPWGKTMISLIQARSSGTSLIYRYLDIYSVLPISTPAISSWIQSAMTMMKSW